MASAGRWQVLRDLCRLAGGWLISEAALPIPPAGGWELLIEAASVHLVTPSVAYTLRGRDGVPSDVGDYFDGVLFLNGERNNDLTGGLARGLAALHAAGITPVLLKGAAALATGLYPDPAMRVLSDIDLLVPREAAGEAAQALQGAGFEACGEDGFDYGAHHHLVPYFDPASGLAIELHVQPVMPQWDRLLPAAPVLEQATPLAFAGGAVLLATPAQRVIHTIVHAQLSDQRHRTRRLGVRPMLELAALIRRHGAAIDWPAVEAVFRAGGQIAVFQDSMEIAAVLFGVAVPGIAYSGTRPLRALQREADTSDAYWLLQRRLRGFAAQPFAPVRLFQRDAWSRRLKAWRNGLRAERW